MDGLFHVVDDGQTGKPALLLVHGFLSSHRHWDANSSLGQAYRLIRVDLPGHGAAPAPPTEEPLTPDTLVRGLEDVRARLGITRWSLCGQSFGAGLTLRYALDFPDRIDAHVFTNANAALAGPWRPERIARNADHIAFLDRLGAAGLKRLPYHPRKARRLPDEARAPLLADAARVDPNVFRRLLTEALPRLSVRSRLSELRVPTLLVNGRFEKSFQPHRDWLAAHRAGVAIVDLDGGHSVNIECAAAFTKAACAFLIAQYSAPGNDILAQGCADVGQDATASTPSGQRTS